MRKYKLSFKTYYAVLSAGQSLREDINLPERLKTL